MDMNKMQEANKQKSKWTLLFLTIVLGAALLFLGSGCSGDAQRFEGIWDLRSVESPDDESNMSERDVQEMRDLGFEAYLNLDEDGSLTLVNFNRALHGTWKTSGANTASATVDDQAATISLEGDTLHLKQQDVTLVFQRTSDEDEEAQVDQANQAPDQEPSENDTGTGQAQSSGLSEMVVYGTLLDEPIVFVDDDICQIVINGTGVDKWGDPGYSIQITNLSSTAIDVWIKDPFAVGQHNVRTYLFETVDVGKSVTSFMQFDTDDLGSTSVAALQDVRGFILVDNDKDMTIKSYQFILSM